MRLSTTYICVKDVEKSLQFYKFFLQKEPLYQNDNRWIVFDCGNLLALIIGNMMRNLSKNLMIFILIKLILIFF